MKASIRKKRQFTAQMPQNYLPALTIFLVTACAVIVVGEYQYDDWHWCGNTFAQTDKGNKWVQNYMNQMVVNADGTCWTTSGWDEAGRTHGVYKDGDVIGNENHNINSGEVTVSGKSFTIEGYRADPKAERKIGNSVSGGGMTIPDIKQPVALGIDRKNNWLMVADDGVGEHVIKFFDVSGSSALLKRTFGQKGGIFSGIPGEVTPDKLWGISGCGCDDAGNIYVSSSVSGSAIRCWTPEGTLKWEVYGMIFSDMGDFAPGSDGQQVIGPEEFMTMDYSQPRNDDLGRGLQWKLNAYTLNYDKYPDDPRYSTGNAAYLQAKCLATALVNGRTFLYGTDMSLASGIWIFKYNFETDGYCAIPVRQYKDFGEPGIFVDNDAAIWHIEGGNITRYECSGLDANGDPIYGTVKKSFNRPAPFNSVMGVCYDPDNDVMYVGGGTPEHPTEGWGHTGPVIARYDTWSTSPKLIWQAVVPWYHNEDPDMNKRVVPSTIEVTGNILFLPYVNSDGDGWFDGRSGTIRLYDIATGAYIDRWLTSQGNGSWIDMQDWGVHGTLCSNGDLLLMREENWKAKFFIFRKKAAGMLTAAFTTAANGT
jgi:hypothetical protein